MIHLETSARFVRRVATTALLSSCVLLVIGCSVYDASLLEGPLVGGAASGGDVGNAGASARAGASATAGDGAIAGDAGEGNIGTGGTPTSAGGGAGEPPDTNAGSGGTPAVGGSSGTGQAGSTPAGGTGPTTLSMIDDMENTDLYIPNTDGRQGYWTLANDGTAGGKQGPSPLLMSAIVGGRDGSMNAFHTTATGFSKSGAQTLVELNRKGATRNPYDASAYKALHFWAKVDGTSPGDVHVALIDKHTDPGGKLCCETMTSCATNGGNIANGLCYDHFTRDLTLTKTWVEYSIPFTDMSQLGWGDNKVASVDATAVYSIQISWTSAAMDLWIDDIAFVKK